MMRKATSTVTVRSGISRAPIDGPVLVSSGSQLRSARLARNRSRRKLPTACHRILHPIRTRTRYPGTAMWPPVHRDGAGQRGAGGGDVGGAGDGGAGDGGGCGAGGCGLGNVGPVLGFGGSPVASAPRAVPAASRHASDKGAAIVRPVAHRHPRACLFMPRAEVEPVARHPPTPRRSSARLLHGPPDHQATRCPRASGCSGSTPAISVFDVPPAGTRPG